MTAPCASIKDYQSTITGTAGSNVLPLVNAFFETGTLTYTKTSADTAYISFAQNAKENLLVNLTTTNTYVTNTNIVFPVAGVYNINMSIQPTYNYQTGAGTQYNFGVALNKSSDIIVLLFVPGGGSLENNGYGVSSSVSYSTTDSATQATNFILTAIYPTTTISSSAQGQANACFTLNLILNVPTAGDLINFVLSDSYNNLMAQSGNGNYSIQLLSSAYPTGF